MGHCQQHGNYPSRTVSGCPHCGCGMFVSTGATNIPACASCAELRAALAHAEVEAAALRAEVAALREVERAAHTVGERCRHTGFCLSATECSCGLSALRNALARLDVAHGEETP